MSFVAPGWLAFAALASLAVVAIHLISWRLPRTVVLPTARFVPDEPARRAARTMRLADLAVLALRVGVVLAAGTALARPVFESRPRGAATVIALEASGGDTAAVRDSLRAIGRGEHTRFVVFDTVARGESESDAMRATGAGVSSLSAGLLAGIREARRLERDYDSVRIVVVSSFDRRSFDNATHPVRALWPDSIRLIRIPPHEQPATPTRVVFDASGDDPVVAGIRLAQAIGLIRGDSRVVRDGSNASAEPGQAVIHWARGNADDSSRVDAVFASGATAIGPYLSLPLGDSGRVIARWANGLPAAREVIRDGTCLRAVGFDIPDVGDFVLSPSFQRLAAQLLAPCASRQFEAAPASLLAVLAAPAATVPSDVQPIAGSRNRIAAMLMALAILLGVVELLVRRRSGPALVEQGA